jgi:hypothetical protein
MPVGLSESFDNVSPPALPPDWLATNALGLRPDHARLRFRDRDSRLVASFAF